MVKESKEFKKRKRNREITLSIFLAIAFCLLVWLEHGLYSFGEKHSENPLIVFGILNLNVIVLLLLSFLFSGTYLKLLLIIEQESLETL